MRNNSNEPLEAFDSYLAFKEGRNRNRAFLPTNGRSRFLSSHAEPDRCRLLLTSERIRDRSCPIRFVFERSAVRCVNLVQIK